MSPGRRQSLVLVSPDRSCTASVRESVERDVRDNHPGLLRKFALAVHAIPTDADACAVHEDVDLLRALLNNRHMTHRPAMVKS